MRYQAVETAYRFVIQCKPRCNKCAADGSDKQQNIGHYYSDESARCTKNDGDEPGPHNNLSGRQAHHNATNLDRRERDQADNHDVVEHAEIDGSETTEKRGSFAVVTFLVEFDVCSYAQAAPESRKDESGEHAGE